MYKRCKLEWKNGIAKEALSNAVMSTKLVERLYFATNNFRLYLID
jgi:hypothetical protein